MKALNLRLPDELHAQLRELAEREHRSLNAEIVARLERSLKGGSADSPPP